MISKKTTKTVRTGQGKRIDRIGSSDAKEKHLDREPPPSYFGRYDKNHKPNHKEELVLRRKLKGYLLNPAKSQGKHKLLNAIGYTMKNSPRERTAGQAFDSPDETKHRGSLRCTFRRRKADQGIGWRGTRIMCKTRPSFIPASIHMRI